MKPQAKINTDAIAYIVNKKGKKNLKLSIELQRAKKAVDALIRYDVVEGYALKALLSSYENKHNEAINYINKAKSFLPKKEVPISVLLRELDIYQVASNWSDITMVLEQLLELLNKNINAYAEEDIQHAISNIVSLSELYLDVNPIKKIRVADVDNIFANLICSIEEKRNYLASLNIDIDVYHKVINIMQKTLFDNYRLNFDFFIELRDNYLSVNYNLNLPANEVSQLNDMLVEKIIDAFLDTDKLEQAMKINAMYLAGFSSALNDSDISKVA